MFASVLESALVRILIDDQIPRRPVGAGFLVTPAHLLTCAHVINDALGRKQNAAERPDIPVFFDFPLLPGQPLLQAEILRWFPVKADSAVGELEDIAVLELPADATLPAGAQPAPIEVLDHKGSFLDDSVRMCGFPAGVDDGTYANGVLQGRTAKGWVEIHHQNRNIVEQGFSGTAVWAVEENAVCGMTVSMLRRGEATVAYMIPALSLLEALPAIDAFNRAANPYRGLKAFREQDARFYFGRNEAADLLQQAVDRQPFTAVIGASGSGKSSLVFAGLLPILSKQGGWLTAACRPKSQPFEELAACLIPFLYEDELERIRKTKECAAELLAGKLSLTDLLRPILSKNSGARLLLIVDQFEELFTLNPDKELVRRYLEGLLAAGQSEGFAALVTMRADFLGAAIAYDLLAEAMNKHRPIMIPPMSGQGLREAVEQPALLLHVRFEPGLAELIVQDVGNEPGSLPLLEFCLAQLWEKQQRRQITHADYKEFGGVQQALAVHADAVFAEFSDEDSEHIRLIFLRLVRPGQGTEDTRQVATLAQFPPKHRRLIKRLADRRLLVTGQDSVEVAHEALICCWQTLRQWVDAEREFLVWRDKLWVLLRQWQESGYDEGALLRGLPLGEALQWQESHAGYLSEDELGFVATSEQVTERLRQEKELALKELEKLFLEAISNLAKVFNEKALAESEKAKEDWNNNEIYQHAVLFSSAALALEIPADKSAVEPISTGFLFTPEVLKIALSSPWDPRYSHYDTVNSVAFSPDGKQIASASNDHSVKLWDIASGRELAVFNDYEKKFKSVAFSPDGKQIVSASDDNTVRLWDIASGRELHVFKGHENGVNSATFSPDGKQIASASWDGTVRLWDIAGNKEKAVFRSHEPSNIYEAFYEAVVSSVAFSPDGKQLASACNDRTVRLWDIASGRELTVFKGHEAEVKSVAFSPDGKQIASASFDKTVRIWDIASGKALTVFKGHEDRVGSVAFSPDGRHFVSGASGVWDYAVRLCDITSGRELAVFKGHESSITSVAFSPDGKQIASASFDKTVRIWNVATASKQNIFTKYEKDYLGSITVSNTVFSPDGTQLACIVHYGVREHIIIVWDAKGREKAVFRLNDTYVHHSLAFSPDGKYISAALDSTIKLWDIATGKELTAFKGHENHVGSAAFSSDGKHLASASWDRTVRLWDIASGRELKVFIGHRDTVNSVAFSPDGKQLASASSDKTVWLWDIANGKETVIFKGHENSIDSVAFAPDGKILASASADYTVRLWDTISGKELTVFKGHERFVNSAAFSPDGKILASASDDMTVRLWDISSGKELAVLKGHERGVNSAAFSPDGKFIVSASEDGTVRIWDVRLFSLFLHNSKPTPLYRTFIEAVKFLWQLDVQGLEIVHKERTPADMERFGALFAPPPPGQSKFDQVLEWAEKQQGK